MLAAVACGEYATVKDAADKIVEVIETIEPEQEIVEKYNKQYFRFVQMYPTVKGLYEL